LDAMPAYPEDSYLAKIGRLAYAAASLGGCC
jgi:hypothetical protein